jgi:hypothetical protein
MYPGDLQKNLKKVYIVYPAQKEWNIRDKRISNWTVDAVTDFFGTAKESVKNSDYWGNDFTTIWVKPVGKQ